jgi:hypothetical protein
MEPLLYSLRAVLRGALILSLSVTVFAQIVAEPDASVFPSGRKAADFSLAVSQPALVPRPVFEFRGIRSFSSVLSVIRVLMRCETIFPEVEKNKRATQLLFEIDFCFPQTSRFTEEYSL